MLAKVDKKTDNLAAVVQAWLAQFELALGDEAALKGLFAADAYWRDVLAFTWDIETVHGRDAIAGALERACASAPRPPASRSRPIAQPRGRSPAPARRAIEAIFRFETAQGRGSGVVRLIADAGEGVKAWTLLTTLDELKGHEETRRPRAPDRAKLFARFPRAELARPAQGGAGLCGSRSGRAGGRRRAGGALDRGAAHAACRSTR